MQVSPIMLMKTNGVKMSDSGLAIMLMKTQVYRGFAIMFMKTKWVCGRPTRRLGTEQALSLGSNKANRGQKRVLGPPSTRGLWLLAARQG